MLLELRKLRKSFSGMPVIRGIDLQVREGELVGIIGPNGAGKTTLFGLMAGELDCDDGQVLLDGTDITGLSAERRCHAGIGRTFQIPRPFGTISVYENALAAATFGRALRGPAAERSACDAIVLCGLADLADTPARELTLLHRKRLELARAVASGPRLLLLDEVAGGLTEAEVHVLLELVVRIHASGVTVLWIEHLVHALVQVAQRLVVLTDGALLADGEPRAIITSPMVRHTYLGSTFDAQPAMRDAAETQDALH